MTTNDEKINANAIAAARAHVFHAIEILEGTLGADFAFTATIKLAEADVELRRLAQAVSVL